MEIVRMGFTDALLEEIYKSFKKTNAFCPTCACNCD